MLNAKQIAERAFTSRKLMMSLTVEPDGTPRIASCEVLGDSYRNRTSWYRPCLIDEVMQPPIAETIRNCLAKISGTSGVVSLPSLLHEHPGLLLSHAHVISSRDDNDKLAVILRFKTFVGSLSEVFRPHVDLVNGLPDATLDLADRIMMDISMPLLNFLALDEVGGVLGQEDAERVVAQLTEQSHALRFQIELIKRHVARLEASRRAPTARSRVGIKGTFEPVAGLPAKDVPQDAGDVASDVVQTVITTQQTNDCMQQPDEDVAYVETRPSGN